MLETLYNISVIMDSLYNILWHGVHWCFSALERVAKSKEDIGTPASNYSVV